MAGGNAGKFSAVFAGWVSGPMGSSQRQPANRGGKHECVIIDPTDERVPIRRTLRNALGHDCRAVALLDIAKPRGNVLIDRLAEHLQDRLPGIEIKPLSQTYLHQAGARGPAPPDRTGERLRYRSASRLRVMHDVQCARLRMV